MTYKRTGKPPGRPKKQPPISGKRPKLTDRKWKALKFEFEHLKGVGHIKPHWGASLREVDKVAGVSHTMVGKWRSDPEYTQGVLWLVIKEVRKRLNDKGPYPPQTILSPFPQLTKNQRYTLLDVELINNWLGPTLSHIDGKTYDDPDSYFRHIQENPDVEWVSDPPPIKKKLR